MEGLEASITRILLVILSFPCMLLEVELFSGIYFLVCGKHREHRLLFELHLALIILSLITFILFELATIEIKFISSELLITLSGVMLICSVIVSFAALITRIVIDKKSKKSEKPN